MRPDPEGRPISRVADRLAAHIVELAYEHDIRIIHRGNGIAYRRRRLITIPPVRGRTSYFVALHELGHIIIQPEPKRRLDQEVAAWRWALEHALEPPTPAVARGIVRSLRSYRRRAELGIHGTVLPPGFDEFLASIEDGTPAGSSTAAS